MANLETTEWLASAATIVAAMMTAANFGARATGYGFVVFTVGSILWTISGVTSGQTSLMVTNGFLIAVNLIGCWRWLGHQRVYEDGGKSAEKSSRRSSSPNLFTPSGLAGRPAKVSDGRKIGQVVETLVEVESGKVSYLVVSAKGLTGLSELRGVPWDKVTIKRSETMLNMPEHEFIDLPILEDGDWPAYVRA